MAVRVLADARDDLRDAAAYYRAIPPPRVGRQLAARVVRAFNLALAGIAAMPLSRQEHPDLPGVRWVQLPTLPYLAFYLVDGADVVVLAVEHDASDYAARVQRRAAAVP
ncbi:MAG: type II toxin-antitoxin system RelE/ParE family toxin [Polyangiaceae bacterium]